MTLEVGRAVHAPGAGGAHEPSAPRIEAASLRRLWNSRPDRAGACGFGAWEVSGIRTDVQKFSAINDNTTRGDRGRQADLDHPARKLALHTVDADEQSAKDAAAAESSAIELLTAAAGATLSEERRTIYNGVKSDVESLRSKRDVLMGLGKQEQADRAKLFSGVDALSAAHRESRPVAPEYFRPRRCGTDGPDRIQRSAGAGRELGASLRRRTPRDRRRSRPTPNMRRPRSPPG